MAEIDSRIMKNMLLTEPNLFTEAILGRISFTLMSGYLFKVLEIL